MKNELTKDDLEVISIALLNLETKRSETNYFPDHMEDYLFRSKLVQETKDVAKKIKVLKKTM